ncbi:MAG: DUF1572 family protein [Bacteroidetes bacterium]|nr:DUF1572 family protein [Bacteroidota bacterium]
MEKGYLLNSISVFKTYQQLADKALAQISETEKIFWLPNKNSNSIAIIMKHMAGNMLSRWTDFLTTDGEKEWRNRDTEFEIDTHNKEELLLFWQKGWSVLFATLTSLNENDLEKIIFIRNEPHKVYEAINRQIAHYAYHVGQITFLAKMITDENWKTLSIAKGKSNEFNQLHHDSKRQ